MTMRELAQYRWLLREIETLRQRIAVLETDTLEPSTRRVAAGVHRTGRRDRMTEYVIHTDDLRAVLLDRQQRADAERLRIERLIAGVPDSLDRQILTHRYVDGYSWTRTAHALGGGNTPEGVRKRAQRALRDPLGGDKNRAAKK